MLGHSNYGSQKEGIKNMPVNKTDLLLNFKKIKRYADRTST